jgi:hypothetical protein
MPDVPVRLAALWTALMLTYLLGDVLRIFAGDFRAGEIGGVPGSPAIWLIAATIMLIPIVMIVVSVTVDGQVVRWAHIVLSIGLLAFNLVGLPTYPGLYDKFLIGVGLVWNTLTIVTAWSWDTA